MTSNYTNVERILLDMPAIGSVTNLSSETILGAYITPAESIVDAALGKLYTVPVLPAPEILVTIATDITIYRLLSRRIFNAQQLKDSVWPDRYKESLSLLEKIAEGELVLPDSSGTPIEGRTDNAVATSNTVNNYQTFQEDDVLDSVIDPNKLEDIADTRRNL